MEQFNKADFTHKVQSGWFRRQHGLETDLGSEYFRLRQCGKSDFEAQSIVFDRFLRKPVGDRSAECLNAMVGIEYTNAIPTGAVKKLVDQVHDVIASRVDQDGKLDTVTIKISVQEYLDLQWTANSLS